MALGYATRGIPHSQNRYRCYVFDHAVSFPLSAQVSMPDPQSCVHDRRHGGESDFSLNPWNDRTTLQHNSVEQLSSLAPAVCTRANTNVKRTLSVQTCLAHMKRRELSRSSFYVRPSMAQPARYTC